MLLKAMESDEKRNNDLRVRNQLLAMDHWNLANSRDWSRFESLLAADMVYEAPQTRERIIGSNGYRDFFSTWPGSWKAIVQKCLADDVSAVTLIEFQSDEPPMAGITFFEMQAGLITKVTDYWPSAYEPAPRASKHVLRY